MIPANKMIQPYHLKIINKKKYSCTKNREKNKFLISKTIIFITKKKKYIVIHRNVCKTQCDIIIKG